MTARKTKRGAARKPLRPNACPVASLALSTSKAIVPANQGEACYRALTIFEALDPEHKTFLVNDNASAPHLRAGEYAVVDTADRELQNGELYVIQWESGMRRRCIVQIRSDLANITGHGAADSLVWWVGDLRGYRKTAEKLEGSIPVYAGLSDGPYETEGLQPKLLGRIIGVAFASLGALMDPTAGYENEEAGNAAFDPAEYLDVLLAAGYGPAVCCDANGNVQSYSEMMPQRRETKAEQAAVLAVRWKYCRASTALDRVVKECLRRELVEN